LGRYTRIIESSLARWPPSAKSRVRPAVDPHNHHGEPPWEAHADMDIYMDNLLEATKGGDHA